MRLVLKKRKIFRLNLLPVLLLPLLAANITYAGNLPPDPGEAGKATLEGIDSDNDGVRDDVQRWIALTYPNSEKVRLALTQRAKINQQYVLNAADPTISKLIAKNIQKSGACLAHVLPNDYYNLGIEFRSIFFNTYDRSKALIRANHHLSGSVFTLVDYEDRKKGCDFNPDLLPN